MNKIGIMMRITLSGESLNNEGTIGNVIQPRQIEYIDGTVRQAISGEMLKHFHSRNLALLADENELCDTCKIFSPMKNGKVKKIDKNLSASGNKVKECLVDDIEGFMNAGKSANEKRTSCIKFGWAIATEENDYQTMLHSRVDPTEGNNKKKTEKESTDNNANTNKSQNTQMLFYRPLRSNVYAIPVEIEMDRIGWDDEKEVYTLTEEEIKNRQKKCLMALKNTFVDMQGAMCSTRLPHLVDIEGIVIQKTDKNEVLTMYSSLNDDYKEVIKQSSNNTKIFNNITEFCKVLDELA